MSVKGQIRDPFGPKLAVAIQPHQQMAVASPREPLKALARRSRISPNRLARMVNDFLADPHLH